MAPLDQQQIDQVRGIIGQYANEIYSASASEANAKMEQMKKDIEQFALKEEAAKLEHQRITEMVATQQNELEATIRRVAESTEQFATEVQAKENSAEQMLEQLRAHAVTKDQIIGELDAKHKALSVLSDNAQRVMAEMAGGWKNTVEAQITALLGDVSAFRVFADQITSRTARVESDVAHLELSPGASGGGGGEGRHRENTIDKAGKWQARGLVYEKYLKIPDFPGESPAVEAFRSWIRDFGRYVERHIDYPSAELLFRATKMYTTPIIDDIDPFYIFAKETMDKLMGDEGPNCDYVKAWKIGTINREKEIYEILEMSLKGKCEGMLKMAPKNRGLEVLRQLNRKFDPENPNLKV